MFLKKAGMLTLTSDKVDLRQKKKKITRVDTPKRHSNAKCKWN